MKRKSYIQPIVFGISLLIIFLTSLPFLQADTTTAAGTGSTTATTTATATTPANTEPAPYRPDEFPDWALKLRRAEIISAGTIPITFLVTFFAYDLIRFGVHQGDPLYNPFTGSVSYTDGEKMGTVLTACGISIGIALIDFWLGEIKAKKERKLKEKTLNASH
jgi:hypothetical protein